MPTSGGIYYASYPLAQDSPIGGELPVLVYIHGAGGSSDVWPYQFRRLLGWRVIAPDLPGHGSTQIPAQRDIKAYALRLLEWLDGLKLQQVVIAGHSMGAAIAIEMALVRPELISQLILLGGAERFPVNPQLLEKLSIPSRVQEGISLIAYWSFSKLSDESLRKAYIAQLSGNPPGLLVEDLRICSTFEPSSAITHLSRPTLILSGDEDFMVPPKLSKELAGRLPRAQFSSIHGAGHMLMQENTEDVGMAIENFLLKPKAD